MSDEKWLKRFTGAQRQKLDQAMDEYHNGLYTTRDFKRLSAFVKRELKIGNGTDVLHVEFKPRNIIGPKDLVKAAIGPWCVSASKHLSTIWNTEHIIHYDSGSTTTEIGQWFSKEYAKIASPPQQSNTVDGRKHQHRERTRSSRLNPTKCSVGHSGDCQLRIKNTHRRRASIGECVGCSAACTCYCSA